MGVQPVQFSRWYRAALLDYLLGNGEKGLARAYGLGRTAIDEGLGLLPIVHAHRLAVNAVLESSWTMTQTLSRLRAAEVFLLESLSPFEMTYRGYVALLKGESNAVTKDRRASRRPVSRKRR
jgi:hypothetical protein